MTLSRLFLISGVIAQLKVWAEEPYHSIIAQMPMPSGADLPLACSRLALVRTEASAEARDAVLEASGPFGILLRNAQFTSASVHHQAFINLFDLTTSQLSKSRIGIGDATAHGVITCIQTHKAAYQTQGDIVKWGTMQIAIDAIKACNGVKARDICIDKLASICDI